MWPQMGSQPGWRSPQTYSAFRACSRGLAGARKRKPQPRTVGGLNIGGPGRNRTVLRTPNPAANHFQLRFNFLCEAAQSRKYKLIRV